MNEPLRRALLRARLSEEDVAARLQVDPKTVRRWLEGRIPYLRYRWALASLLGLDDADLWPQTSTVTSRPAEVQAIYPHRDEIPLEAWRSLLASAKQKIDILAATELFLGDNPEIVALLSERARSGVPVRICLGSRSMPDWSAPRPKARTEPSGNVSPGTLAAYRAIRQANGVEVRLHAASLTSLIYCCDDTRLVVQLAYGVPDGRCPAIHLRQAGSTGLVSSYSDYFDHMWTQARSISE